ncbi:hypothetical protein BCL57_000031 [Agromyces flavus]|nr:hypothetical protein [Agromyces flavus]MCP2365889.1 hypothetical protein [Agromyces flavus]GGI43583.1 hypothetical protein GCM10010932_00320 [Agromyces flavus]
MSVSTRRRGAIAAAAAVAFAGTLIVAPSASARPLENFTFTEHEAFTDLNFCDVGLSVEVDLTREVHVLFNSRKPGTAPYWKGNYTVDATYTTENGMVREHIRGVEKDLRITDNGDGTMTILVLSTGNATVYDESGKAIARNPGQVRFEVLIDYGDDITDPSDDEFLEFLGQVKGSTGRSDDFCEAALPILE